MFVAAGVWKSAGLFTETLADKEPKKNQDASAVLEFWDHYNRASESQNNGDYEQAAFQYERALQINDEHAGSLYQLGNARLLLREFREAEESWLKLTQMNPRSARAWLQLGTLYFCRDEQNKLFDLSSAKQSFRKAHDLNREETGPPLHLSKIALLEGDLEEAERYTDIVLGQNFMSYQAIFLKGYIEWLKGNRKRSNEKFVEAHELFQNFNQTRLVGEGATKAGSRPMLSEDMYCDFIGDRIESILESINESNPETRTGLVFQQFKESLEGGSEPEKK